jgi:YegS/Rv2252/BmrU family lipid kinase
MSESKKNMIIINPNAGKGLGYRLAHQIESMFKEKDFDFATRYTYGVKHAIEIAKKAVADGYSKIVAVGGDGTINEVANGIAEAQRKIDFGVVSIGTGNDYIKAVGIPDGLSEAVDTVIAGKIRKVDIGQVENHYFVNGLGIGFDAKVAEDLYKVKRLRGFAAYMSAVVKNLLFFKNPEIELAFNNDYIKRKTLMVSVMIGNYLGGGFYLTPEAKVDDGLFDILSLGDFKLLQRFRHLPKVPKGTHFLVEGVELYQSDEVVISSEDDLKVHIDGEMADINSKRFKVKLLKQKLNLIVP